MTGSRLRGRGPELALAAGMLIVAGVAMSLGVRISSWALDETFVKQSALHYLEDFPGNLFADPNSRATSRLYPLLLSPLMSAFDGDTAIRLARGLNSLLFVSAAIPAFLLAARVLRSRLAAAAVGLMAVACPWVMLTTVLFQENLAYPLFLWSLLAMVRAVERRGMWADVVALLGIAAAVTARVQLAFVFVGWLAAIWVIAAAEAHHLPRRRFAGFARAAWGIAPVTHALLGAGVLVLLWRAATNHLRDDLYRLLGVYSEIQDRPTLSPDVSLSVAAEVAIFALGTGVLAAAGALVWWIYAVRERARAPETWRFAVVTILVAVFLVGITAYVQGGWLGTRTEERYYLYAFPLVWIGAFAFFEDRRRTPFELLLGAGFLLFVLAGTGLPREASYEGTFLAPASTMTHHLVGRTIDMLGLEGMSVRDGTFIAGALGSAVVLAVMARVPRSRLAAVVVVPAVVQLGLTLYAFAARSDWIQTIEGGTRADFEVLGWVDEAARGEPTWLANQRHPPGETPVGTQIAHVFWNSSIRSTAWDPELRLPRLPSPVDTLPMRTLQFDLRTGRVGGADGVREIVSSDMSPLLQLEGARRGGALGLELVELSRPARARWVQRGLDLDGAVLGDRRVELYAFGTPRRRLALTLVFRAPPDGGGRARLTFAGRARELVFYEPNAEQRVTVGGCADDGRVRGRIEPLQASRLLDGRSIAATLVAVERRGDGGPCR